MRDGTVRNAVLVLLCAVGLGACVAETPVDGALDGGAGGEGGAGGAGGGAGGEGGGRYTDPDVRPDAGEDWTCESACRPTGVCPGTQFCTLRGCCAEPSAAVIEHLAIGRGEGVLVLKGELYDDTYDAETVVVTLGEAVHTLNLQYTVAERTALRSAIYTDSQATEAQVYVRDRAGVESAPITVPVVDLPIRGRLAPCDATGFDDWCGQGALCLDPEVEPNVYPEEGDTGLCFPASAEVWQRDPEAFWLDVRSEAPAGVAPSINAFTVDGQLVSPWGVDNAAGWRFVGLFWEAQPGSKVRYLHHLLRDGTAPRAPVARLEGQDCDPERMADRCPADTACLASRCTSISAPSMGVVSAVWRDGLLALTLGGNDGQADAHGFRVEVVGSPEAPFVGRFGDRRLGDGRWVESGANWAAERFVAWFTAPVSDTPPAFVRVTVIDDEGLESETQEAPVRVVAPGEVLDAFGSGCDSSGLLGRCEDGRLCDAEGTDTSARCRLPRETCAEREVTALVPDANGVAVLEQLIVENGMPDEPLTCVGNASGVTRFFSYVAPANGRYRFSLSDTWGGPFHLAVRPYCNLWRELACVARTVEVENPSIELDLRASQALTVAVMATWSRSMGAPVTLKVEPLP